jgi:NADH:ubiquinone oxidoreductase subunit F (NADH-binding)
LCDRAPAALVDDDQAGPLLPSDIMALQEGYRGIQTDYSYPHPDEVRVMMAHAGLIDPDSIQSAITHDGYRALEKALSLTPDQVIEEVEASGLTGRGGAGFPVGRKWRFVANAEDERRYVVCNADESEPLIFKDRVLIDSNPHQILEGITIAGYATGSKEAYIYIRGEYLHQARRLERAIQQAEAAGYLGDKVCGRDFSFHIHVHLGAGAYICGEETALIESLEGKRGEPRFRPPYPPSYGYHGHPTLVNNVESYAAVPSILRNGSSWYRSIGTTGTNEASKRTPGTKLYMLLGHINKPGLFEAPFGLTLRQVIDVFGAGMQPGSTFHFALTGGAAGTIVPEALIDIPIDYASAGQGISLGAGAFLICDQSISPVNFLRELLHFFTIESCGKCTPCRIGTNDSLQILNKLVEGTGQASDIDELKKLADVMQVASFCGLGQSVAIPVKSALTQFPQEFLIATGLK